MDKKKRLIQLTEGILLCCVIVVMTLLCIGIIKKEVKNTKGKLTETTGWYRIQDNKKSASRSKSEDKDRYARKTCTI
mgnify:FL=1